MTQDFAKPSTTRKPGQPRKKNGPTQRPSQSSREHKQKTKRKNLPNMPEKQPKSPNRQILFIISLILLLGGFAYGLYLLQSVPETHSPTENESVPQKTIEKKPAKPASKAEKELENKFSFYELLPKNEVIAPKVDVYKFKEKASPDDYYYIVQTGSFKNFQDAEKQKAMIAFKGIKADIETITNDQGTTWYRVSTGPFYDRSKMNSALDKLVSMHIQPLVKKIKKPS